MPQPCTHTYTHIHAKTPHASKAVTSIVSLDDNAMCTLTKHLQGVAQYDLMRINRPNLVLLALLIRAYDHCHTHNDRCDGYHEAQYHRDVGHALSAYFGLCAYTFALGVRREVRVVPEVTLAVACFDIDQERRVVDLLAVGEDLCVCMCVTVSMQACLQSRASILIRKGELSI